MSRLEELHNTFLSGTFWALRLFFLPQTDAKKMLLQKKTSYLNLEIQANVALAMSHPVSPGTRAHIGWACNILQVPQYRPNEPKLCFISQKGHEDKIQLVLI